MDFSHKSVLLSETIDNLSIKPQGIYVDGTLGGGGHAFHVCEKLSSKGRLSGIDQDEAAIRGDGQMLWTVSTGDVVWIEKAKETFDMIRLGDVSFFDKMRSKLNRD